MKRSRTIIGLLLILFAIGGLIFWEVKGRESVLLDNVIVATEAIPAGTLITSEHLSCAGVPADNKIDGALDWQMMPKVLGKIALQDIVRNGQVSKSYLGEEDFFVGDNQSIYVIHPEWISMCSSSIRRGDLVEIYGEPAMERIGTYRVAFVKDLNDIEVTDGEGRKESNPLQRTISTSAVSHIEIISDMNEYEKIIKYISDGGGLFIIQKGGLRSE